MNDIVWMDRYWKEVLEVSTWKHSIKGSVSLRYQYDFLLKSKVKVKNKYSELKFL